MDTSAAASVEATSNGVPPPPLAAAMFRVPTKRILTPAQLAAFQASATHADIIGFIERLNEAVRGVKLDDDIEESEAVKAVLRMLDAVQQIAEDTPPVPNAASRFGNPAFRTFYDRVAEASPALHATHLVPLGLPAAAIPELSAYFRESWGSRTRIDYGSGMELNWVCWMLGLTKLSIFRVDPPNSSTAAVTAATAATTTSVPSTQPITASDALPLALRVFWRYVGVMRLLQARYWLEPAGSHGVWGLDDYHFLPFLWGSGQLVGHKYIRPRAIHDAEVVEEYAKHYMYFACIAFINSIKTASLRWHSPMLDDISAVKTWDKVNSGMCKMYRAEVLGKLPVMQHFLFGSLLDFTGGEAVGAEGVEGGAGASVSADADADAGVDGVSQGAGEKDGSENAEHSKEAKGRAEAHKEERAAADSCRVGEDGVPSCAQHSGVHAHGARHIHPRVLASLAARGELPEGAEVGGSTRGDGVAGDTDTGAAGQSAVGWGSCCGIAVPSIFAAAAAAAAEAGEDGGGGASASALGKGGYVLSGVRPVPFD